MYTKVVSQEVLVFKMHLLEGTNPFTGSVNYFTKKSKIIRVRKNMCNKLESVEAATQIFGIFRLVVPSQEPIILFVNAKRETETRAIAHGTNLWRH